MYKQIKKKLKKIVNVFREKNYIPIPHQVNTTKILENKNALIIGGSGGIGKAIAVSFVKNGAKVIISGTSDEKLSRIKNELNNSVETIKIDIKDVASFQAKILEAEKIYGNIDILVNSAGILAHHKFLEISEEEYDSVMDINAKGTFFMSQAIAKYMIEKKIKGHILNITSSSSVRPAWTPYQMSKWAVRGFTLGASDVLLPYGIIVNAIAPGPVATPMLRKEETDSIYMKNQPSERYAMPEEIANMATYLVSDFGNLVVGDTLFMTGGSGNLSLKY